LNIESVQQTSDFNDATGHSLGALAASASPHLVIIIYHQNCLLSSQHCLNLNNVICCSLAFPSSSTQHITPLCALTTSPSAHCLLDSQHSQTILETWATMMQPKCENNSANKAAMPTSILLCTMSSQPQQHHAAHGTCTGACPGARQKGRHVWCMARMCPTGQSHGECEHVIVPTLIYRLNWMMASSAGGG
jgi:hypothetical protein